MSASTPPPQGELSEHTTPARPLDLRGIAVSTLVNLLGVSLAVTGIWAMSRADAIEEAEQEQVASAAQVYTQADEALAEVQESLRLLPRASEAGRWVSAAQTAATQVAVKQDLFLAATSPLDSTAMPHPPPPNSSPNREPSAQELDEWVTSWRSDIVAQTEREMVMLVSPADRDGEGLDASGQWYELVPGLRGDVSGYSWQATTNPTIDAQLRLPMDWVLTQDASGDPVAVMRAYYHPHSRIFGGFEFYVLDQEEGS